jgi:uncharacterized protein (TIGR00251 family)
MLRNSATSSMISLRAASDGVIFAIKVQPRAKKNAITGELGDALKVTLTAPPIEGRANEACIEFFARLLKVSRSSITIASGERSRMKMIRVIGLSSQELQDRLYSKAPSAAEGRSRA